MDRIFVAAEPIEGVDAETLAEILADATPDTDVREDTQDGVATAYAWPNRHEPFDVITGIDEIQRAVHLDYIDTAGAGTVSYFDRPDGPLRLIETAGYTGAGAGLNYVHREYGFAVEDGRVW